MQKQYKELTSKQTLQMQWNENELVTRRWNLFQDVALPEKHPAKGIASA